MAFVMKKQRIVKRSVDIREPADGKSANVATVQVTFELIPTAEDEVAYDREYFKRRIRNVEGLVQLVGEGSEEKQEPVPFCPEVLDAWLAEDFVVPDLQRHYINMMVAGSKGN